MSESKVKKSPTELEREQGKTRSDWTILLGGLFIVVATLIVYIPAMRAGFIWDDPDYVINNQLLRSFDGLVEMWTQPTQLPQWYPLVHTTFWIEYHLWELWPAGYHIDNVLLHITSSLLICRLLRNLQVPGAWLAASIFALHPVQVESVAWVTERKNVLSCVLYLLSLLTYLQYDSLRDQPRRKLRRRRYLGAMAIFIAALLSKTVVATLPASILVILWWKRGSIRLKDITPLVPFFIIGAAMGLLTAYLEVHHVGAQSDRIIELNLSPIDRVLIAGRAVCFYATKLVWPWPLVFIYPQWKPISPGIWWQWIFPIITASAIVSLILLRNRITRGPAAAVMIFCGTLFPALGFFNVYPMRFSYVADHFQYHASIAMIALIAALLWTYAKQFSAIALIPLAIITLIRTPVYDDAEALWRHTLTQNSNSWMVYTNLGKVLVERAEQNGDERLFDEASALYDKALELDPNIHDTHTNVATMLARKGQDERAIAEFERSLQINPSFAPAMLGLGRIYQRQGKPDQARDYIEKALKIESQYPQASYAMGNLLDQQGDLLGAATNYRLAVAGMPADFDARYNLGTVLLKLRQYPEAVYNLREAVNIRPQSAEAWSNLGWSELRSLHPDDAARSFRKALLINPNLTPAQTGLQQATQ